MNRRIVISGVGSLAIATALALSVAAPGDEDSWSTASLRARFPDPDASARDADLFGGTKQCKECHEDRWKSLDASVHAKPLRDKKTASRLCEACHGPGAAHVDDESQPMRNPAWTTDYLAGLAPPPPPVAPPKEGAEPEAPRKRVPVSVADMNGVCLRCHAEEPKQEGDAKRPSAKHRDWVLPKDGKAARSCVSCHSVHVPAAAYDPAAPGFATIADLAKQASPSDPVVCASCHARMDDPVFHPKMAQSGHAFLMRDGPDHGCAACHGAGSLHVASGGFPHLIVNPERQKAPDVVAACNACHEKGRTVEKWTCSEHSRQGVSCIECHDANAPKGRTLRKPEIELCGRCHQDVKAQFLLSNRHRVPEGRVQCSDCHDPHGNTDRVRDQDLRFKACLACHQDKGGPFLFDHGIKRDEGCTACHDPHGSVNRRMLSFARMKPMCMQCHPEVPHDFKGKSGRQFDDCLNCHVEIHGSDVNRFFLR